MYIIANMTHSSEDPVWITPVPVPPADAGLFYVRWWGGGSTRPVEYDFRSRAKARAKLDELYKAAPFLRIEMLEASEWGTRSHPKKLR